MAQRAHVPKFGDFDSEDKVPYTMYFDKARQGRGGKITNPNDPQENPDLFPNIASSDSAPPPSRTNAQAEEPIVRRGGGVAIRQTRDHQDPVSREEGNLRQFVDSPGRNDNMGDRTAGDQSAYQQYGRGTNSTRASKQSIGSDHSIERSPLHPHYQPKVRGGDGKTSYESSHGTPVRSRVKPPAGGEESPDRGAVIPRFGDWDENNPQSAENYTDIFNKVKEERHNGPSNVLGSGSAQSTYPNRQRQNKQPKVCCTIL